MLSRRVSGLAMALASAGLLTSCSTLPASGPTTQQITSRASTRNQLTDYVLVDLSQPVVDVLSHYRVTPFATRFASARPAPGQIVGVGDVLDVTLFEAGQGGLFTSQNGARVQLQQRVDTDGTISVPYAGRVKAAGVAPQVVERRIVAALEGRAIQPQALVQIQDTVSRSYVVNGDVGKSGRYPITAAGDRILDVIATSGGAKQAPYETRITLQRGSAQGTAIMQNLIESQADNVYVQPGDRIYVTKDPEMFLAFGAVPRTGPINFGLERISLLEAVGLAGGAIDQRSDPGAVFLFRYEPASAVRSIQPSYDGHLGDKVPVVYRLNLRDPQAFFYAKSLIMRDRDVLYVANAPITELQKFLQIVSGATQIATTGTTVEQIARY